MQASPPPPPHNPYAPPQAQSEPRWTPPSRSAMTSVTWLYAGAMVVKIVCVAAYYAKDATLQTIAYRLSLPVGWAGAILALVWIDLAWRAVPPTHRGTISPRRAALSMLLPIYNAYWALAMNRALCDALNGILERARSPRRAPKTLGTLAGATWLGALVLVSAITAAHAPSAWFGLAAPAVTGGLWFTYALQTNLACAEVARLGADSPALAAPRLSQLQRERGPGVWMAVSVFAMLLLGLACWQFLSPGDRSDSHVGAPATHAR